MSNVVPLDARATPGDEAAAWVARIDAGPLSPAERQRLEAWLAVDPLHPRLLDEHARAWVLAGAVRGRRGAAHPGWSRRRIVGAAVAASAAAVLGVTFAGGPNQTGASYSTRVGESRSVLLPDGSRLLLNTDSELAVVYTDGLRGLRLSRGEALFDVAHDEGRPFEVAAAGTVTRAVGTRFSVRALSPTRVAVVVTQGRVEVRHGEARGAAARAAPSAVQVGVGQQALAGAADVVVARLERPELERRTGWTTGGIRFREERLADVLAEVNRYTAGKVTLAEPDLADVRVSGYFATGNVPGFVASLSLGAGLQAVPGPGGGTILSRI